MWLINTIVVIAEGICNKTMCLRNTEGMLQILTGYIAHIWCLKGPVLLLSYKKSHKTSILVHLTF